MPQVLLHQAGTGPPLQVWLLPSAEPRQCLESHGSFQTVQEMSWTTVRGSKVSACFPGLAREFVAGESSLFMLAVPVLCVEDLQTKCRPL